MAFKRSNIPAGSRSLNLAQLLHRPVGQRLSFGDTRPTSLHEQLMDRFCIQQGLHLHSESSTQIPRTHKEIFYLIVWKGLIKIL